MEVHWPGADLKILFESLLAALLSFVAGPIVPAAVGFFFWIHSGDLTLIDHLILLELATATVGYWLLVFFSASLNDSWSSLLPEAVIRQARQLGVGTTFIALGIVLAIFFFTSGLPSAA